MHHINYLTDGKCQHCGVAETVSHFLVDCNGSSEAVASSHKDNINYKNARHQMRKRLRDIATLESKKFHVFQLSRSWVFRQKSDRT